MLSANGGRNEPSGLRSDYSRLSRERSRCTLCRGRFFCPVLFPDVDAGLWCGKVGDAMLVAALKSTKNKDGKRDEEMHQTKR